jgi:hypothetical protein
MQRNPPHEIRRPSAADIPRNSARKSRRHVRLHKAMLAEGFI